MTYSLANTGATVNPQGAMSNNPNLVKNHQIDDAIVNSPMAEQQAMSLNTPFLGKRADGGQAWYVLDAERTIPGVLRVLRRL